MVSSSSSRGNQLLAALPDAQWKRWLPHLELVTLPLGHVLYEATQAGAQRMSCLANAP